MCAAGGLNSTGDMTENPDSETGFLEQLGRRVRTMRALHGMSRKVLAILSGQTSGASALRRTPFAGIALIGLRGAGKSTLGKMLAKKIGWSFVELNKEIEAQNGLSVAEIIALYGQEGFRRLEQAALGQLLARKELMVLATGGGIVSEPLTFDLILSSFYTIWLKAEPEEHMG